MTGLTPGRRRPAEVIARRLMMIAPVTPDENDPTLRERFELRAYTEANHERRHAFETEVARSRHEHEQMLPLHRLLGLPESAMRAQLRGRKVMELGCFAGGSTAAIAERYEIGEMVGVDIDERFLGAARRFVSQRPARCSFVHGYGEALPFPDDEFDAIVTEDTFEHVEDLSTTLAECRRVLTSGGRLYAAFPGWYHPWGNHLALVSATPWLHLLFSDATLEAAYRAILAERGEAAYWYAPDNSVAMKRRRFYNVNGTSVARFRRLATEAGFRIERWHLAPLFLHGRRAERSPWLRRVGIPLRPLSAAPVLEEILLNRICVVLRNPG